MMFENMEAHTAWLLLGIALCIAEMVIPGVFMMFLGLAALLTGVIAYALPIGIPLQLVLFAGLAIASIYIGRRWTDSRQIASDDPLLNDRLARLVGERVTVVEPIAHGEGRVRVGDSVWPARGADAAPGSVLVVTGATGGVLDVSAI